MEGQTSFIDRIIFWVFGGALFLSIGLLPNVLFSRYMETWSVHWITYTTVAVTFALFWGVYRLRSNAK